MPKIKVTINREGNIKTEGLEYFNNSCLVDGNKISGLLGQVQSQELKPEALVVETTEAEQQQDMYM